jgi:hypothetical protein
VAPPALSSPAPAPPAAAPPAPLNPSLTVARTSRRKLGRGIQIRLGCGAACAGVFELQVDARTAKRLRLKSRSVGRTTTRLGAAGSTAKRIAIPRSVARRLAKLRAAKLTVLARVSGDAGGVTLRRRAALTR